MHSRSDQFAAYKQARVKEDGWMRLAIDLKVGERVKLIAGNEQGVHEVLEVGDGAFRTVDYEAIAMLNLSVTQGLARKLESESTELAALKQELAEMRKLVSQLVENKRNAGLASDSPTPSRAAGNTRESLAGPVSMNSN